MIRCQQLSLHRGGKTLFENASFIIQPGERVAIVGRNGAGKSSLMRLIAGELSPDSGVIDSNGLRIADLPQAVPVDCTGTVAEVVMSGLDEEARWQKQHELPVLLAGLGLTADASMNVLSGGQARRVLLAKAIMQEPDVLLLDEPTNHLDMQAIQWLEDFLKHCRMTVLFVTHDRSLLQAVATAVLTVSPHGVSLWKGDYRGYLQYQADQERAREKEEQEFDKRLAQEEVWIRKGIQARRTRNEGRVRALEAMRREHAKRQESVGQVSMSQHALRGSGKIVVEVEGLSHGFAEQDLIRDFSCLVSRGSKIGIVGPNGVGKTTLLRCLLGEETPRKGEVHLGTQLSVAYFDQHRHALQEEETVLEAVAGGCDFIEIGGAKKHIYSYLQDFLFTPDQARARIKTLSGGERNRVMLAKYLSQPANVLVLDEPTNDLDIETLELLEDYLMQYQGTVFLISHDRSFLNNVVTHTWLFSREGAIEQHVGGVDSNDLLNTAPVPREEPRPSTPKTSAVSSLSHEGRKEYNRIPDRIAKKEKAIDELHQRMADPSFYEQSAATIESVQAKCAALEKECEALYDRWEELDARLGAA